VPTVLVTRDVLMMVVDVVPHQVYKISNAIRLKQKGTASACVFLQPLLRVAFYHLCDGVDQANVRHVTNHRQRLLKTLHMPLVMVRLLLKYVVEDVLGNWFQNVVFVFF
jgi:hypothetical protein